MKPADIIIDWFSLWANGLAQYKKQRIANNRIERK